MRLLGNKGAHLKTKVFVWFEDASGGYDGMTVEKMLFAVEQPAARGRRLCHPIQV